MLRGIVRFAFVLIAIFLIAGRLDYWQGWVYGAIALTLGLLAAILLAGSPDLIEERVHPGPGVKWWDRLFVALYLPSFLSISLLAALDAGRLGWSPDLPPVVYMFAYIALLGEIGLILWSMYANRFFSSVVRIQSERGHRVVESGPYRFLRHPGYVGFLFLGPTIALALGSLWALIPASMTFTLILIRTALEDATLRRELPGYAEYACKVKYRLLPGVW
jgi:protein-S-isoprenylcysteine O-methyltransferase Ste14